ncbi:MAG: hypothetical protein PHI18_02575 [bacterium]|nr:hypothetical protein [bacterium]
MVTSYKDLHYDVLNIGKQEAWMGLETLVALMDTTPGTEFVSANLVAANTRKPIANPYVIKDFGKIRVGVLGVLNEADFPPGTLLLDTTKMRVIPAYEAVQKYVPALSRKVDAVVLLSDLPSTTLDTILAKIPEIDVVISAGALRTGENAARVVNSQVVGTGSSGYAGHYATLEFNPAWGDSIGFTNFLDQLTDIYDEQGLWAERQAAFEAKPAVNRPATPPPAQAGSTSGLKPTVVPSTGTPPPSKAAPTPAQLNRTEKTKKG